MEWKQSKTRIRKLYRGLYLLKCLSHLVQLIFGRMSFQEILGLRSSFLTINQGSQSKEITFICSKSVIQCFSASWYTKCIHTL